MQLNSMRNRSICSKGLKSIRATGRRNCQVKGIYDHDSIRSMRIRVTVERYFFVAPHDIVLTEQNHVIDCVHFVNDQGEAVEKFRDFGRSGYFNLYINGMMQGGSFYRIGPTRLFLNATGQPIYQGTPIIIESIGFFLKKRR